jgi:formamidopyrimidine-DNA glycosylase
MPELPEVEAVRLLMEKNCMGKRVRVVSPFEQGGGARNGQFDDIVMGEGANAASITAAFGHRNVKALHRRGKQIWFELSGEGPSILFHLGMTGTVVLEGHDVMKYKAFKVCLG